MQGGVRVCLECMHRGRGCERVSVHTGACARVLVSVCSVWCGLVVSVDMFVCGGVSQGVNKRIRTHTHLHGPTEPQAGPPPGPSIISPTPTPPTADPGSGWHGPTSGRPLGAAGTLHHKQRELSPTLPSSKPFPPGLGTVCARARAPSPCRTPQGLAGRHPGPRRA